MRGLSRQRRDAWLALLVLAWALLLPPLGAAGSPHTSADTLFGPVCTSASKTYERGDEAPPVGETHRHGLSGCECAPCGTCAASAPSLGCATLAAACEGGYSQLGAVLDDPARWVAARPPLPARGPPRL